jgi:hypothetical protein
MSPLFLVLCLTQTPPQLELDKVTLRRNDRGHLEAHLVLKQDLPDTLKKVTVRLIFVQEGSGLTPRTITDIPAPADMTFRAGQGWSHAGGAMTYRGKPAGFFIDLCPFKTWTTADAKTIIIPLTQTSLPDRKNFRLHREKGDFLVALVQAATLDDARTPISNTVSTMVNEAAR